MIEELSPAEVRRRMKEKVAFVVNVVITVTDCPYRAT